MAADDLELRQAAIRLSVQRGLDRNRIALRLGGHLDQSGLGLVVAHDDAGFGLEIGVAVGVDGTGEDDEGAISAHG